MLLTRLEAQKSGVSRYGGKVCAKHPELNGERYAASYAGLHTPYNLQVIPATENLQKSNRVEVQHG